VVHIPEFKPDPNKVAQSKGREESRAQIGLILSVVGLLGCPLLCFIGLYFSLVALSEERDRGFAVAGVITACLALLLHVGSFLFFFLVIGLEAA